MRTSHFRRGAIATIAAASMLLAACGDDASTDVTETAEPAAAATTEEVETEDTATESVETEDTATEDMATGDMATEAESALTMEPVGEACSAIAADGEGSSEGMADDPVATAASNNELLSTLVTAVGQAELVDTLNSAEALTVFAPVNDAFAAIDQETLDAVLADKDQLTEILTVHVAGENLDAEALTANPTVTTLQGGELQFDADAMTVTSPDGTTANVICANVQTANATVHLIDSVLFPAS